MNFELTNFEENDYSAAISPRKIKLRSVSFTNVCDHFNSFCSSIKSDIDNDNAMNFGNIAIPEVDNVIKMPITVPSLEDTISLLDIDWDNAISIKRRALSLSSIMFSNMCSNVNIPSMDFDVENSDELDEDEIKQAVKDAFQQIKFRDNVKNDVVITPEEVSDTVEVSNDDITGNQEISFSTDLANNDSDAEYSDKNIFSTEEPLFKFENINFDNINSDYVSNSVENDVSNIIFNNDSVNEFSDSFELKNLLDKVKELKMKKSEQDKKTQNAVDLAREKEKEKDEVKAKFMAYQASIEEDLDKSKKIEKENLERAREAEKFTSVLVDIMNQ